MIKWTFLFNEGGINTVAATEEEDKRLSDFVSDGDFDQVLYLKGDAGEYWVNMAMVKAACREELADQPAPTIESVVDAVTPV